jgi:hypothetical protein
MRNRIKDTIDFKSGVDIGFIPGGSGTTIRHNTQIRISHKITHHSQTNHSSQSYTNNKGHSTHNEYCAKKKK